MKKGSPTCTGLIALAILSFSISLIVLLAKSYNNTFHYDKYFRDAKDNHQLAGYDEITAQKIPCSQDYQSILKYKVPGVEAHYKKLSYDYKKGSCNLDDFLCENFREMDPIDIQNLKGLFLCGKKISISFSQTQNSDKNGKCPNNYKICGKDTQQNLCFPNNISCPINDIQIFETKQDHLIQQNYKEQEIMDNKNQNVYIYTSNEQINNQIPVEFKFGYQQICVDPEQEQAPIEQFQFFKKNYQRQCQTKIGEYTTDDRYKNLYSISKLQLFDDNEIIESMEYYSAFDSYTVNYDINIFSRANIHFDQSCKQFFYENQENTQFQQIIQEKIGHFHGQLIFCFVVFGCTAIMSLFIVFYNWQDSKNQDIYFLVVSIITILYLISLGIIINLYKKVTHRDRKIIELGKMDCGDKIFNQMVDQSAQESQVANGRFLTSLIIVATYLLLYIIYTLFTFCSFKKKKKHQIYNFEQYNMHDQQNSSDSDDDYDDDDDFAYQKLSKYSNQMKVTHYTDNSNKKDRQPRRQNNNQNHELSQKFHL